MHEYLNEPKITPKQFDCSNSIIKCPICDKEVGFQLETHLHDVHKARACKQCHGWVSIDRGYCTKCFPESV